MSGITAEDVRQYLEEKSKTKVAMPAGARSMLQHFLEGHHDITGCTFQYIIEFFNGAKDIPRLEVACADYGYTMQELFVLRKCGATAADLAREVLARGKDPKEDE